jgi:quercetin dioxygenase-like cupin family protein
MNGRGDDLKSTFELAKVLDYQPGSIVSRVILKSGGGNVTVFAFDAGEGLSEHTTPFDALVTILDGTGTVTIAGNEQTLTAGQSILFPADVPHAVRADERFKMLLVMVKGG